MADLAITNTFTSFTLAESSEVNTNFSDVETYVNNPFVDDSRIISRGVSAISLSRAADPNGAAVTDDHIDLDSIDGDKIVDGSISAAKLGVGVVSGVTINTDQTITGTKTWEKINDSDPAIGTKSIADFDYAFRLNADGTHEWGDTLGATDVTLGRADANVLTIGVTDSLAIPGLFTFIPGSGVNGQIIMYQDAGQMATDGVVWMLRYNDASASAYKWEFVGGASMVAESSTADFITSTTPTDVTGSQITAPADGDYIVSSTNNINNDLSTSGKKIGVRHAFGIVVGLENNMDRGITLNDDAHGTITITDDRLNSISSGDIARVQANVNNATGANVQLTSRHISIYPVRLG